MRILFFFKFIVAASDVPENDGSVQSYKSQTHMWYIFSEITYKTAFQRRRSLQSWQHTDSTIKRNSLFGLQGLAMARGQMHEIRRKSWCPNVKNSLPQVKKKEKCVQSVFPLYRNDGNGDNNNNINNNIYLSMINIAEGEA